ncbi:MAG: hypothetical protein Q9219_001860 [cf. Caloplaca sp. 3 TL-2023]
MAPPLDEQVQVRLHEQDRNVRNRRSRSVDLRREYDSYIPNHRSTAAAEPYRPLSGRSSIQLINNKITKLRDQSPVTSFLAQFPLEEKGPLQNGHPLPSGKNKDFDQKQSKANGEDVIREKSGSTPALKSTPGKRSAPSPTPASKYDDTIKRQRKNPTDNDPQSKPTATAKSVASVQRPAKPAVGHARQQVQEHVGTQTDDIPIASSRRSKLQEEEAIAQIKHTAEMKRRKEALELEFEYERKMLQLRYEYEHTIAKEREFASSIHQSKRSDVFETHSQAAEGAADAESAASEENILPEEEEIEGEEEEDMTLPTEELKIYGASRHSSVTPQPSPEPQAVNQLPDTAAQPPSRPRTPVEPNGHIFGTSKADVAKGSAHAASEPKDRAESTASTSLVIETSKSPTAERRYREDAEEPRWPKVKHLTCHFWKNGHCTKSAAQCSYAHHDTGAVAAAPDMIRKAKRAASLYRRGGW